MEPQDSFWWRLTHLDPAVYKAVVVAVVGLLVALGIKVAPGVPDQVILLVVALAAVVQGLWTRKGVTPNAKVVAYLPDPFVPHAIEAGEAATTASDAAILEAAKTAGGAQ